MSAETTDTLPHLITIVGRGVPSNYEITVEGKIELIGADPLEEATVVTDHAAEGAVDIGVMRFRFSGQMANVQVGDWNGVPAPDSPSTPGVHIDYGAPARDGT
ncbi:hypothetical protein [Natrarchaeobius chitinivorans]|uniref:Uncharacterized protein n=1 Tax=Natrarchaeobius chitinivorans TaxID=1679083 RepID=A0A3N6MZ44_NATCH|nr:hypothetical protein [Natrarchaeobius chitinivorans]RQG90852.1 hypothetical protein EA473_19820 [Natrarchaeobius chitinivorans]